MSDHRTAFVVEDDAHSLIAIGAILSELGISFKRDTSGAAVISKLKAMFPRPNFILLDMDLPGGDPYAIIETLKADPELAHIPVIALAESARAGILARAREVGFAGYMTKPLPRREFGALLNRILAGEPNWQRV